MADNVVTNPGAGGDTIGADEIAGAKYQRVKIIQGIDGVNDGDVSSSAPLQVTLANTGANATPVVVDLGANNDVTIAGVATAANQTDKSQFTKITDGTDTALVTALGEQNVLETNSAAIKTAVETIDNAIAGSEMQVDVITMPTTTVQATDLDVRNLVFATDKVDTSGSTLAANSGVDIGDVTINNGAGVAAVNIQDGGNTITVDGAVTTSGTVTEANSAAILTSSQLLDDTVKTLGTDTYTEASTKANVIGAVRRDADTTLVDTTNEIAPLQVDANGRLKVEVFSGETLPVSGAVTNTVLSVVGGGSEATAQRVTIANDSTGVLSVDDNGSTISVDDGAASLSVDWNGTQPVTGSGTATGALRVELPTNGTGTVGLNAGTNNIGDVDVLTINGVAPAFNTGARSATTQRVTIATDDVVPASQSGTWTVQPGNTANTTPWLVAQQTYSTSSVTSVAGSATSVQLLASTSGRKAAYFYNDSGAICYLKLGTTASTSSFTVAMAANSFYELPYPSYTGRIDAIWASATGNIRITEIT